MLSNIAVQSYCFRGLKTNAEVAETASECGFNNIELCGVHADFEDPATFDTVIDTYRDRGIEVVSIGVQHFANDKVRERHFFEFAGLCGAKCISTDFAIDSVPTAYRTVEELAEEFGINIAIHNHGGPHWLGSANALHNVFAKTSPRIGLCLDTAWALDAREDPVAMARDFADRLYSIHIKDFVFDRAGKPSDVVAGRGNLDIAALVDVLRQTDFNGPLIIEYEGDVENPAPALKQCNAALKDALTES